MSIHDSLAVFTAILIARHCFSLQDLVVHVVLPSLLAARPTGKSVIEVLCEKHESSLLFFVFQELDIT